MKAVLLGAGAFARELLDALRLAGEVEVAGLTDRDERMHGTLVDGVPVLGGDDVLDRLRASGFTHGIVAVGGVGDNEPRQRLYERLVQAGLTPCLVTHPRSIVASSVQRGAGSLVMAGAVINVDAMLHEDALVNYNAGIDHDCVIGAHASVGPGATLAGNVILEPCAFVGVGATILQGVTIGDGAIVGAGAVVIKDVPARSVVAGVPAKVIRSLDD